MRLGVGAAIVDGALVPGDVSIEGGVVTAVGLPGKGTGVAVPGFVDLQVNGFADVDFATAASDGYRRATQALYASGVTSFQPTLITAPEAELVAALSEIPADVLGAHLEGPFLSPERLGAHPAGARRDPDAALLERLLAAGPVAHVTLAPELPGALELVDLLHARSVVVSFGHSNATAAEANAGFDHGVKTVTHLFNAMRPFHHREPGIAGAALARAGIDVQLIVDGVHLADEIVRLVLAAAPGRVALVSDAVRDGASRRSDGTLAGSTTTLLESVRRLHALGASLEEAVGAATVVPARIAQRPELGSFAPGSPADVVVLDDRLEIACVLVAGRLVA